MNSVIFILNLEFTKHMKKECDEQEFDNHMLKNEMNRYLEAYLKYKNTMRDSSGNYNKEK